MTEAVRVEMLRKVTKVVKVFPYLYTFILICLSPFDAWLPLRGAELLGLLTFTCVPSAWLCWKLSKIISLCP